MIRQIYWMLCLCICATLTAGAQTQSLLNTPYKPSFKKGTIDAFIADMQIKTHVAISFSSASLDFSQQVSINGKSRTLGDALKEILDGQGIDIIERKDKILLVPQAIKKKANTKTTTTINGYIKDEENKEVLIGAIIYVPDVGAAITTNEYGYYSITIPSGAHNLVTSYIGYTTDTFYFNTVDDVRKDIYLKTGQTLSEVVVKSKEKQVGYTQLTISDINGKPVLVGESDVMRALQSQAGVQCGADGTSSVLVRGGDPGQNLNLLDGVPVYYVDHFFGLTSIFNNEAIKSVDFYKGAFPARYGGRLSSIIDVNTKDGDMENWGGQFTMGLVKGSLNVEGPIIKDKASVMFSARRTWLDLFWRPFTSDLKLDFYDVNGKVNYILNPNNRLYISFYNGRDQLSGNSDILYSRGRWGNTVTSAKWNSILNPKLFINTIFTYSTFKYQLNESNATTDSILASNVSTYNNSSLISDASVKLRANWYPSSVHKVETGIQYTRSKFVPVSIETTDPNNITTIQNTSFQSNEITLYSEDEIKLTDKWSLRPGLHWANWISKDYTYSSLQPRLYSSYKIKPEHIVYASATKMSQFLHSINNNMVGFQSDFWLPSTDKIQPEESLMGTIGYSGHALKNLDFNIEAYYKDIQNITMYNPGKNIFDNVSTWDEKLLQGHGWSYGTELSLQEKLGAFYFNAAYTLSWSWRQFVQLNDGKAFPYKYDRRHNIKTSVSYKPNRKFAATANWTYMSGEAITIPDQVYGDLDDNLNINTSNIGTTGNYIFTYSKWNNYRLPPIHRLDIGCDFIKQKKKSERTWSVGIFNAYGRRNILYADITSNGQGQFELIGQSLFMYIPYVSYRLKF